MRVKICGITRAEDALQAVEAGASALGFIFVQSSPRYIRPEQARAIIAEIPPFVVPVGVFVDAGRPDIMRLIDETGIRCLQLHGHETPEETVGYPVPVFKGFRVSQDFDLEALGTYPSRTFLLDAHVAGIYGGTGRTFDWRIALAARRFGRIIVGGGITPENVGEAIAAAAPFAIDVSSGVESAPGIKDSGKIRRLFDAVAGAEDQLREGLRNSSARTF